MGDTSPCKATDEGMGGGGRYTVPPSQQVPENRGHQSREHDDHSRLPCQDILFHGFSDGIRHSVVFEDKKCGEVENCGPDHRLERRQNFCGYDRCDGVCRIVESIDVIEDKRQRNDGD